MSSLSESWRIFTKNVRPGRLFQEERGVKGPLWFGRNPDSAWHGIANFLRLFFAICLAPIWSFLPSASSRPAKELIKRILWGLEWANTPDAVLLESPGSLILEKGTLKVPSSGQYAVTGNKPHWLLKVEFRGKTIVSQHQVKYGREREKKGEEDGLNQSRKVGGPRTRSQLSRYTAISYAFDSANEIFKASGQKLDSQPDITPGGKRKYSLASRKRIAQVVLDEYARTRETVNSEGNDIEFIWLDEFCLSDEEITNEEECKEQRDIELGQLADIFRRAEQVVVFCHVEDCDHTGFDCPWCQRLFTLGEILYTQKVLVMTRSKDWDTQKSSSHIVVVSGQDFRVDMQARAAEKKMWHLYNIMQHVTNSGGVPWQSAIHSLVVEAIRRDKAGEFNDHRFLGKALNGLLPRRSQLGDLHGINGWADLAWLLELNQGYYNTTLLVAVCKLADPTVQNYRWWGEPIAPKEGSERLEALVTSIPIQIRKHKDSPHEPALSIISPKSIALTHWLQRDSSALYHRREMKSLKWWMIGSAFVLSMFGFGICFVDLAAGIVIIWLVAIAYVILELLVGTIFVKQDMWFVAEDHNVPGGNAHRWLERQDPFFNQSAAEWGPRQLIPQWGSWDLKNNNTPTKPYGVTLIDLRTGVWTKAIVTSRPNDMVILAVHGSGITCMLLDREEKEVKSTIATKVGMANLPPFALAQSEDSGTVYVGGKAKKSADGRHNRRSPYPSSSVGKYVPKEGEPGV
ncbi:hypothetical protein D9756_009810 [Leucocoprinus leucothites]|uniref:Heterokaryon incompatibility domain-containing protein n=1 Tax=Leucocoprinus leucothites TaxID=201217 RepID=A0A8H5CVV1_9AGAR|nr:hypothetical protein D9756_009810 [Leucoagaricus leucothites]